MSLSKGGKIRGRGAYFYKILYFPPELTVIMKILLGESHEVDYFQPFETYSINDIIEARSRVGADWDWEKLVDEAEVNEDYVLIAVVELDAIKRFLSISDKDVKDLSINEDGDYLRLRLRSGETRYFYERGNQLKDEDTGKLILIHL